MAAGYRVDELPRTLHALLEERAAGRPDHPFLMADDRTWTFAELDAHADRIAQALWRRGVRPGHRVLVMMGGCGTYLALWFAVSKLGAVEVPVNGAYRGAMLRHVLETAPVVAAVVEAPLRGVFLDAAAGLVDAADVIDPLAFAHDALDDLGLTAEYRAAVRTGPGDPAGVIFTSGTTGPSKGVVMSHRHQMSFGLFFAEIAGFRADDTAYNYLPFFHIAAKFVALGAMLQGGRMLLRPVFSLSRFWDDVRAYGATVCVAVGGLCHLLNSQPERPDDADNPLRLIYAVPVPWEFKDRFERRFGLRLVEAYGGTESNLVVHSRLDEDTPRGSCGRASEHFEVTIRDDDGYEAPRGQAGEVCVRPRHPHTMMTGYLGLPEKTLEVMAGYWFHTGDRAHMDADGYVFFLDRMKDAIRRRGENISSYEVEIELLAHPAVREAAAVAVPSEHGEDEVMAVLSLLPGAGLDPADLIAFLQPRLPHFMIPRYVQILPDLPKTPTQKAEKHRLRAAGITPDTWDRVAAGIRIRRDRIGDG